jgi:predicted HD superfamily hydrolase involved in NAD metabolism
MAEYNLIKLQKKMKKELDSARYQHTLGVMYTAASLAMCYGANLEQALVAGLLHDCAQCIPNDKKIRMCKEHGIEISKVELDAPYLLHSKLGAYLAKEKYGVKDPEIISAIQWHTTGRPNMTTLEKIIFTADYIEPGRFTASNLSQIRKMAFEDIDEALLKILYDTLVYLHTTGNPVDPMTQKTYEYYKQLFEENAIYD